MSFNEMEADYFTNLTAELDFSLSAKQLAQFELFMAELVNWNRKFNLTTITETKEILIKHFYDSILGLKAWSWQGQEKVLDLGTGAGFPGIPIKIILPSVELTLVDSLQKRINFLQNITAKLSLNKTEVVHGRAEDLGQNILYREKYDVVVSRAVAALPILAEYCLPFLNVGGYFLAYKGAEGVEEGNLAQGAIQKLGGKTMEVVSFVLPEELSRRRIIIIQKVQPTSSRYPRRAGVPIKKPLL